MAVRLKKGESGKLDLTPMIDVVFQLVLFFLVATRFEEEERSLPVKLPVAGEAKPMTAKPRELYINISDKGEFIVSAKVLTRNQLFETLRQSWADNPGRQSVIIRADRRCPFEYVATAMDLCNKANIRDYQVATAQAESSK